MLIRKPILQKIKDGSISILFRKWKRPTVKSGGTLKTSVGVLEIHAVKKIKPSEITEKDCAGAGFENRESLLEGLPDKPDSDLYRIIVSWVGEDPRIKLRNTDKLTPEETDEILMRLKEMDERGSRGPWTLQVMELIDEFPDCRAADLSDKLGLEKDWLKTHVRKLKNMGLTESRRTGYRISPRGKKVMQSLRDAGVQVKSDMK